MPDPTRTSQPAGTAAPGFLTGSLGVKTKGTGTTQTCQYVLLLHKPMSELRIDAMNSASKMGKWKVTAAKVGAGYRITSQFVPCSKVNTKGVSVSAERTDATRTILAAFNPAGTANIGVLPVALKLSDEAKSYLTIALSIVIGGVIGIVVAVFLPEIAAAIGLTMSEAAASVVAACIAGIAGNLVDKAINGGSKKEIVISSVLSCVASSAVGGVSAWLSRNRPAVQSMVSQALSRSTSNASSESESAVSSVFQSARSSFSSSDFPSQDAIIQEVELALGHASA